MKFLGGLLNVLAVFVLVAATAICTAVVVLAEGVIEAIVVMGLAWVCALLVALNIMGTGIALLQICKLKKKIQRLERMPGGAPAVEYPVAEMPEVTVPPVVQDTYTVPQPERKKTGLWIALAVVAVVVVIAVILFAMGGKPEANDNQVLETAGTQPEYQFEISPPTDPMSEPEQSTGGERLPLAIGETMSVGFVDMRFDDVTVAADIKLSVTTGIVTRITGPDPLAGQQYICLSGKIMNTSTSPLPVYDFFVGNFSIDGYNYEVSANDCDVLTPDGDTVTEIDPLMEYDFRIYTAIPDALADSFSSCTFTYGFYDGFANEEMSYNKAFSDDPIGMCPYQYELLVR